MLRIVVLIISLVAGLPAVAQEFPGSQPIRIVVPFNPGGTTDLLGRSLAEFLQKQMNHTVLVENRPGAAAAIGVDFVDKSAPDGHTLLLAGADLAVLPAMRKDLPYNIEELTYVNQFFIGIPVIVTGPNSGINTLQDLIAKIKANPGKLKNATNGVGSLSHLGSLKLDAAIGGKSVHVPYSGQGPASIDTLAGITDFFNGAGVPLLDGLKVLAPVGSVRHPAYPDLPTLGESGFKAAEWNAWFGVVAPPKTPKAIVDKLNENINAVLRDPAFREKVTMAAKIAPVTEAVTGDAFRKIVMDDLAEFKKIAEAENLVIQ